MPAPIGQSRISAEARVFLHATIKSVWALEFLLLLRSKRDRTWSVDEIKEESGASEATLRQILSTFKTVGLLGVETDDRVRYAPAVPSLEQIVSEIATAYAWRPLYILNEVLAASKNNIELFAKSFYIRKDE